MVARFVSRRWSLVFGALAILLLTLACAKSEEATAPAATPATPPAPVAPSTPTPIAAPAPAPSPTPAATLQGGLAFADVFTTRQVPGGPKIDAAAIQKEKSVQLVLKYHPNRFPLWTKAKYRGEVTSAAATSDPTLNALTIATRRNYHYGRLLSYDQGLCSWVGRDADFSVCKGEYALNAFVAIMPSIIQRCEQPDPVTYLLHVRKGALWSAVPPMNRENREITADDVKWYLDIMKEKSVYRDSFVEMKSTEALDRYTVKVITIAPLPDFLRNIAQSGIGIFPLNHVWPWDLVQASEMNAAAHIWDFWYSLGVAWLSMQDPDKIRK